MQTNNLKNSSTISPPKASSQREKYQVTRLRPNEDISFPHLVIPTNQTPKLICRYISGNTIENLDTIADPDIWQNSSEIKFNSKAIDGVEDGPLTFVRFAWTDKHLLFYVEVEQPEKEAFLNNDKVWMGDNIEFLISPIWYDQPLYNEYEFLFNSQHAHNDLYWTKGRDLAKALNKYSSGIQWKIKPELSFHKELRGWSMTGKIPFSDFKVFQPSAGDYWGLGLFRKSCNLDGSVLLQAWSPPLNDPPKFHTPSRFGMLVFTK